MYEENAKDKLSFDFLLRKIVSLPWIYKGDPS